jgi:hypothetical protein
MYTFVSVAKTQRHPLGSPRAVNRRLPAGTEASMLTAHFTDEVLGRNYSVRVTGNSVRVMGPGLHPRLGARATWSDNLEDFKLSRTEGFSAAETSTLETGTWFAIVARVNAILRHASSLEELGALIVEHRRYLLLCHWHTLKDFSPGKPAPRGPTTVVAWDATHVLRIEDKRVVRTPRFEHEDFAPGALPVFLVRPACGDCHRFRGALAGVRKYQELPVDEYGKTWLVVVAEDLDDAHQKAAQVFSGGRPLAFGEVLA